METVELITLLLLPAFLVLDLVHQGHRWTATRFWRLRALLVSGAVVGLSIGVATFWGTHLAGHSLLHLSGLGTWAGALVGVLVYELGHYTYHRFAHKNDTLWRWAHQMHHSAESLDAFGANYLSPIDTIAFTSISSLVFFPLLGLSTGAGVIGTLFLAFNAVFQHANLNTPRWIGYIVQRPESHSLHHGRGVHAHNYADLPIIDMLFGTFCNPREHREEVGFWNGASARLGAMLIGRDVSAPDERVAGGSSRSGPRDLVSAATCAIRPRRPDLR
jgi:sterol desaturase/sphingolipid hydroxylase (fatty acid hydroxylase superfamily)